MRVLLDTHALLWASMQPALLSETAAAVVESEANTILVSAASAWEIATKVRIGKLPGALDFESNFLFYLKEAGYVQLAIDATVALRAGRLPGEHRDPFDRMIAAQALTEDIPVVSADRSLDGFGVRRIW